MGDVTSETGKRRRRYPLWFRLQCLRALLAPQRPPKSTFSRRVRLYAGRFNIAVSTIWRWLALYRKGGVDALRDHLRRDTLTRRAPANVASITSGAPVHLPLDTPKVQR
jgi:transposase-like protein